MSERRFYLSVCAIYRDEAPNLREWVAFHRVVGVEHFYLYNNDSTDAHLEALAPFIEEGVVTLRDWSLFPGQVQAYEECLRLHADESRWIAFIDLDEFLFSPTGRTVAEVLGDYESFPGVVVNWAMYGTSGHERRPTGLVIENYLRRTVETEYNRHLKSIVDPREVRSFCGPHFFVYRNGLAVDENKNPILPGPNRTDAVSFERLRINHYMTRSLEEYQRKLERPSPDVGRTKGLTPQQVERRLEKLDQVSDGSILMYLPALRRELGEDSRGRFAAYAARARAKPSFDAEEREYRLEVVEAMREVLDAARAGAPVLPGLRGVLSDQMGQHPYSLIAAGHKRWILAWASAGDGGLTRALARLADPEESPVRRVDILAKAAESATAEDDMENGDGVAAVLAFASLLNFTLEPEHLPIIRPLLFEQLEGILGYASHNARAAALQYEHHVHFAEATRAFLSKAEIPIRDMLDVESLIVIAAQDRDFWAPDEEAERLPGGPAPRPPVPWKRSARRPEAYLSVCAIYRDEAPYLAEWLEFHRLVGAERFFLYNNLSEDEHREILSPYIAEGLVTLHDWPLFPGQRQAYDHCIAEYGERSRWIAFIDIDEFLFSPTGRPVSELLVDYEAWPGVAVNRPKFGTSGHRSKPSGLVIENYLMRAETIASTHVKSIVDPSMVVRSASAHHFTYKRCCAVDENGYPVHGLMTKSASFERLRVNHYYSKSEEELRRKRATRTADFGAERRPMLDFAELRRAEDSISERDEAILRYVPALREALARPHFREIST